MPTPSVGGIWPERQLFEGKLSSRSATGLSFHCRGQTCRRPRACSRMKMTHTGCATALRIDVGRPAHHAPLLSFVGNQLSEVGMRKRKCRGPEISEPYHDFRIAKTRTDLPC